MVDKCSIWETHVGTSVDRITGFRRESVFIDLHAIYEEDLEFLSNAGHVLTRSIKQAISAGHSAFPEMRMLLTTDL